MILFRGADRTVQTHPKDIADSNREILGHRYNFDNDVEVLAKLCEDVMGPSGCSPKSHSLHHMIRKLLDLKGHPTFEMIVERLASKPFPLCL